MQKIIEFKEVCCETPKDATSSHHADCVAFHSKAGELSLTPELAQLTLPGVVSSGLYSFLDSNWAVFSKVPRASTLNAYLGIFNFILFSNP